MIEIFKTNVESEEDAGFLKGFLQEIFPLARITFDLGDCDRILRIETSGAPEELLKTTEILCKNGFFCEVLPDEILPKSAQTDLKKRLTLTFKNSMRTPQ